MLLWNLPDKNNWKFDKIKGQNTERATRLESVESRENLLTELNNAFKKAIEKKTLRIGRESAGKCPSDYRAVFQFPVGTNLFDWFFNGRTGYRAHFKTDPWCGLTFNATAIEGIREIVTNDFPAIVEGWTFEEGCLNIQSHEIQKCFLLHSLHPYWSKLWSCDTRIAHPNTLQPNISRTGPKILIGSEEWAAIYPDNDDDAWLDVKGGFLQHDLLRLYQPKDPLERAKNLHTRGSA